MITDKQALEYVRGLKEYCREQLKSSTCDKCSFYEMFKYNLCPVADGIELLERVDGTPL